MKFVGFPDCSFAIKDENGQYMGDIYKFGKVYHFDTIEGSSYGMDEVQEILDKMKELNNA